MKQEQPIQKSSPVTPSEQYLQQLGDASFLSLWSYPRIFRDQHGGKEICDLLVVFDRDIIIFSDKHCEFKITDRPCVDWGRWFRKAIEESAQQLWGAERWIRDHSDRMFLDNTCLEPFPLKIDQDARFFRITVAHGAEDYAKSFGRAGLAIEPGIIGEQHYGEHCQPFKIGQLDPLRGFVHVFDRTALTAVMQTLDTIQDFVTYLRDKEAFVLSEKLSFAASEQDLLAAYLNNPNSEYSFEIPARFKAAVVPENNWETFKDSPRRRAQQSANRISYYWDQLIESYGRHILERSLHPDTSSHDIVSNETLLRFLARESRTRRRALSRGLIEFVTKKKSGFRTVMAEDSTVTYVFAATPTNPQLPNDERSQLRMIDLIRYCISLRLRYPALLDVIGIAVEADNLNPDSMQLVYFNGRQWGPEQEAEALAIREEYGFASNINWQGSYVTNFPDVPNQPKNSRNKPCACGSGVKYKKCCGAPK